MKKIYPILFLLLAACGFSYAQPAHLSVDNLTTDNGLPSNVVNDIMQDGRGYMWFATHRSVVRYDGYTMHTYNLRITENGWYNEDIFRLFKDKQGNIWAGLQPGGVFRYDPATDRFIHYSHKANDKQSLPHENAFYFVDGLHNDVWIMTANISYSLWAMCRFEAKTGKIINYGPAKNEKDDLRFINAVHLDASGNMWASAGKFLYRFNDKQRSYIKYASFPFNITDFFFEKDIIWLSGNGLVKFDVKTKTSLLFKHSVNDASNLQNDTSYNILRDKEHRPWIVTITGLSRLDPSTNKFTNYPFDKNIPKGYYYAVPDKSGNFWFVNYFTKQSLLVYFNTQNDRYKVYPPQSLKQGVSGLFVDDTNNLWFRNAGGVSRINNVRSAFTNYTINDTAFNGTIQAFLECGKNTLYLITDNGLYQYNLEDQTSKRLKYSDYNPRDLVSGIPSMVKNDDGTIAIGNLDLVLFDPKNGSTHTFNYNKKPLYCSSILPAGNTGYWVGSQTLGLLYFDRKTGNFKDFKSNANRPANPDKRILDDSTVTVVYRDKSGTIWAGTSFGGLNRFNPKDSSFTSAVYQYPEMTDVNDIHEDKSGQFWVATDVNGLFLFDRKTWRIIRHFSKKDGLLSTGIDKIIEDNNGRIWLTSTLGLVSVDIKTFAFKKYTHDNALPTNNINAQPYRMSDGTELFSTSNGFFSVRLDDLKPDPDAPVVHIETVLHSNPESSSGKADTVRALVQKQAELPYSQNRVTFNFVGLHYAFPLANRYSYQLINFDKNWVDAQTQRTVTYNNLSPGTYIFKVRAANADDVWNNTGDTFTLIIHAPWWTRWWAWLLWIVLFVSAVYGFIAYRSRKLLQDKKVLEHKVHIRTEEVMQQKEEIESQRDNLEKTLGDLKSTQTQLIQSEKMASLGELTAGIAHEIQNPLNFVNNFSDVNAELLVEMQQEIEKGDLAEIKALSLDIYENEKKINQHGKRADSIVKGMLEHSRTRSGQKEPTDLNAMADEFMRLSYHGLRAKDKTFNSELVTDFDPDLPKINVIQQDMGRVLLNLFNNAFYAVNQKKNTAGADYKPTVSVTTLIRDRHAVVIVKDNGIGIPDAIKAKIMQPFFTTKPTGEGTGLGLSLTYDMVVKGHGGDIRVNSVEGEGSEFIISLPVG